MILFFYAAIFVTATTGILFTFIVLFLIPYSNIFPKQYISVFAALGILNYAVAILIVVKMDTIRGECENHNAKGTINYIKPE